MWVGCLLTLGELLADAGYPAGSWDWFSFDGARLNAHCRFGRLAKAGIAPSTHPHDLSSLEPFSPTLNSKKQIRKGENRTSKGG